MITITFNEKEYKTNSKTLDEFIKEQNIKNLNGSAFAINNKVINSKNFNTQILKNEDKILFIQASQGG